MLASAAPRRSSFARSSSLARPCSSGSTTPSAGISNCHARERTKRASSVSSTHGSVTGVRIDLDRESRGSTTRDDTRILVFGQTNPVQICDIDIERASVRSRVHESRARRHAPVGLEHHSSSVSTLSIRVSSVCRSTRRRGVRTHSE